MHLSEFTPRVGGSGDTRGIRLQTNHNPWELDRAPKPKGGKLDTSHGFSKTNYITSTIARPREFRQHIFNQGWELDPIF